MLEITAADVQKLAPCLQALAAHHNAVSTHFKGDYPSRPIEETLRHFAQALRGQSARSAAIEAENRIAGFCKIDLCGADGKLDYLVVLPEARGKGYGRQLMDWAMQAFEDSSVHRIAVKVIDGNAAIHLYEKYGFQINAHILVKNC